MGLNLCRVRFQHRNFARYLPGDCGVARIVRHCLLNQEPLDEPGDSRGLTNTSLNNYDIGGEGHDLLLHRLPSAY